LFALLQKEFFLDYQVTNYHGFIYSFLLSEANFRVIFLLSGKLLEFQRIAVGGLVGFWSPSFSLFQGVSRRGPK